MNLVSQSSPSPADRKRRHALLALLGEPDAFARLDDDAALVFAPRKGVTVRIGAGRSADLLALESDGAVRRVPGRRAASFMLDAAGAARLRREAAPASEMFSSQHGERDMTAGAGEPARTVNLQESPLLWLRRRGGDLIGDAEFAAGERLRAEMTLARTLPSLSPDWERPSRSGVAMPLAPSEARLAAAQRVQAALRAVGPELSGVLVDVCGFLKGLDAIERERGWPARSAKLALCLALAALARHYGLSNAAIGVRGRRSHRWGAADSRPPFSAAEPAAPPT